MRRMMIVMGAISAAVCINNAWGSDDDILFAEKNFFDSGYSVGISGTLTGGDLGYKNNTYSINCIEDRKECLIASIEQIGERQIGRLDYAYTIPITKWGADEVVATDESSDWSCWKTTITINRKTQTGLWVEEPINRSRSQCQKADDKVRKHSIEDSLGWKRLQSR
jgi:hypothetical protein